MSTKDQLSWQSDPGLEALTVQYANFLPELVIAITRPQGADDKPTMKRLRDLFDQHHYHVVEIQISNLIENFYPELNRVASDSPLEKQSYDAYERKIKLMQWGDQLRAGIDTTVAAMLAVRYIAAHRKVHQDEAREQQMGGVAFVVRNLMHPKEVALFRSLYKQRFFLIGVHEEHKDRLERLTKQFLRDGVEDAEAKANHILQIDSGARPSEGRFSVGSLNVNDTFHQADLFVANPEKDAKVLERWIAQVFGNPFGTPTPEELAMAFAYLSARQSASLGRSVGSAIVSPDFNLLSIGWNDPAKAGGGLYREGLHPDHRDHTNGEDPSDSRRLTALTQFLQSLLFSNWSSVDVEKLPPEPRKWLLKLRESVEPLVGIDRSIVKSLPAIRELAASRLLNIIEFGRSVHAEMAAITDAARRGIAIQGSHLYVTTFPCHECARNIVAAGITKVIFVEPYGKSLATDLYADSIQFLTSPSTKVDGDRVVFVPYVGISPKRFDDLFSNVERKYPLQKVATRPDLQEGTIVEWQISSSKLRSSIKGYVGERELIDPYFEIAKQMAEQSTLKHLSESLLTLRKGYEIGKTI